jgi:hypothetical protein
MLMSALALWLIGGCQAGPRNFLNENDRLRAENLDLRQQVEQLTRQRDALLRSVAALQQAETAELPWPSELPPPRCAQLELGGLSGPIDTDNDGVNDALRVYLRTLDARGRFVLTIADVQITVARIPAGEAAETLTTVSLTPEQFDEAYRSGLGGTHYSLTVPLPTIIEAPPAEVSVSIAVRDRLTGRTISTVKTIELRQAADLREVRQSVTSDEAIR